MQWRWFLVLLAGVGLLGGCSHTPVVKGFTQEEARIFILGKLGNAPPAQSRFAEHYRGQTTKTTDTRFICNRSDRLEMVLNYTVTRVEGNYVAFDAAHFEDCDNAVTRYKLDGWFNETHLYLRSAGAASTYVFLMEISPDGRKLTDAGDFRYVDGVLSWRRHLKNGEARGSGGYYYTTGYLAHTDVARVEAEFQQMQRGDQQARQRVREQEREESRRASAQTASQIAMFSSALASQMSQQSATLAREQAAALERQNQLRAAEAATARRNQQLLAAAAASRSSSTTSSSQNTLQPSVSASGGMSSRSATNATATALASAERERQAAQQREQEERQRAAKAAADKAAADRAAAEKLAAERAAAEKAASEERKARREAEKKAEAEAKARAEQDYLQRLAAGTRMGAKNCYGEQHVMGAMPNIKPKPVACIDMHFRAYCQGSHPSVAYQGVLKNMVSMGTGCFGDTVEIKPKLGCKAEDIRVEVTQARPCS